MCSKFKKLSVCNEQIFQNALKKDSGCLPGTQGCNGFQKIFGGKVNKDCKPWDLICTLSDYFEQPEPLRRQLLDTNLEHSLLTRMPKTALTADESKHISEFAFLLSGDIWQKGLK